MKVCIHNKALNQQNKIVTTLSTKWKKINLVSLEKKCHRNAHKENLQYKKEGKGQQRTR